MARVTIEMLPGRTKAQKAELARVITDAMVTIAKMKPDNVDIIFRETGKEDWSRAGTLASDK